MSEPTVRPTSIKAKSPRVLADMIEWTQADFYPDPTSTASAATAAASAKAEHERATVNFSKLDDDNVWSDV